MRKDHSYHQQIISLDVFYLSVNIRINMFLESCNQKIINLQVFVTLGDGVVFGELSILNVPGSKVHF